MNVYVYNRVFDLTTKKVPTPKVKDIFDVYEAVFSGILKKQTDFIVQKYSDAIKANFVGFDKTQYQEDKINRLPAAVFSGCFDRLKPIQDQSEIQHSRRVNMDIDLNTPTELNQFYEVIKSGQISFIEAAARSISGTVNGSLWINILCEITDKYSIEVADYFELTPNNYKEKLHRGYYDLFSDYLQNNYQIKTGHTCDLKRLRYLCHDEDGYLNYEAEMLTFEHLKAWIETKPKVTRKTYTHSTEIDNNKDPFKIAYTFAEKERGACIPGNVHNFLLVFATVLNRIGISQSEVEQYVTGNLGISITTNCIEYPYKKYTQDHGSWTDWNTKPAPQKVGTAQAKAEHISDSKPEIIKPKKKTWQANQFKALGFDKNEEGVQAFYFHVAACQTPIRLTVGKMTRHNLQMLAPLQYWQTKYPKPKSTEFALDNAIDDLIAMGNEAGYYSGRNIRGRGAWIDDNRTVIHMGDRLLCDWEEMRLTELDTEFIYELGAKLNFGHNNPMQASEAEKLISILERLNWEKQSDPILLAGWIAIAPICGVLSWRPHIWITGEAGSGKSTVFRDVVKCMLSNIALSVKGTTTESAIRQTLRNDTIPVLFEEAEGTDLRAQDRIQMVIELARAASDDNGSILKGGQSGKAMEFNIRSVFACVSIVPQFHNQSDRRRFSMFNLKRGGESSKWHETEIMIHETFTPNFVERFQARIIANIPFILESMAVINKQATKMLKSKPLADQLSPMISGAWHIFNDTVITENEAIELLNTLDITERIEEQAPDQIQCIRKILSKEVRMDTGIFKSIGELLYMERWGVKPDDGTETKDVRQKLGKCGLMLKFEDKKYRVYISNNSNFIIDTLTGTPYAKNHGEVLRRLETAKQENKPKYFCQADTSRCISVDFDIILCDE